MSYKLTFILLYLGAVYGIKYTFLTRIFKVAAVKLIGNLRWRRFRGNGDRTGRESLELRQPSLPVKNQIGRAHV